MFFLEPLVLAKTLPPTVTGVTNLTSVVVKVILLTILVQSLVQILCFCLFGYCCPGTVKSESSAKMCHFFSEGGG